MTDNKPAGFWRREWLNLATFVVFAGIGAFEQSRDGQFRFFMLPGWPTYGVLLALYCVGLYVQYGRRKTPDSPAGEG